MAKGKARTLSSYGEAQASTSSLKVNDKSRRRTTPVLGDIWTTRVHRRHHVAPPAHHVVQNQRLVDFIPFVPSMLPAGKKEAYPQKSTLQTADGKPLESDETQSDTSDEQAIDAQDGKPSSKPKRKKRKRYIRTGFKNPWDSWHSPSITELWSGLSWKSNDENRGHTNFKEFQVAIDEAHTRESSGIVANIVPEMLRANSVTEFFGISSRTGTVDASNGEGIHLNAEDLHLRTPDFGNDATKDEVRATWLGHASVLVQLPTLGEDDNEAVRVLFDPIFSNRCSPTQALGPARLYSAPCSIAELPPIDIVAISHSHYDHLDYDSIVQLWERNIDRLRFVVPMGNKSWFLELGLKIPKDRVVELDWWDDVTFSTSNNALASGKHLPRLRLVCTPAQHGSGRYGFDNSKTLWSSWTVEHISKHGTFRVFFGGDTGYQFHTAAAHLSTDTPDKSKEGTPEAKAETESPVQSMPGDFVQEADAERERTYPTCPAFAEVRAHIGPIDLAFLPISVGASFNYVKSYDSLGLVPSLDSGLTGSNHMTPDDAVRVSQILTSSATVTKIGDDAASPKSTNSPGTTIAMHWGTFVSGIDEVRRSMRDVKTSCEKRGVTYVRDPKPRVLASSGHVAENTTEQGGENAGRGRFALLDHGQSMVFEIAKA